MKYCVSCGAMIPDGQKICSICYGDPEYGRDGYYRELLEKQAQEEAAKHQFIREREEQ